MKSDFLQFPDISHKQTEAQFMRVRAQELVAQPVVEADLEMGRRIMAGNHATIPEELLMAAALEAAKRLGVFE